MSEMIERVARAIWERGPIKDGPWNDDLNVWDRADDRDRRICRFQARAAIEAMREPTEEMIEAGARILDMDAAEDAYHSPFSARRIVEEIYRAMIDEALK